MQAVKELNEQVNGLEEDRRDKTAKLERKGWKDAGRKEKLKKGKTADRDN